MTVTMEFPQETAMPVQQMAMYFPQGNDIQVTAHYPNIPPGTAGAKSEFYYKTDRTVPDNDPTTKVYTAQVVDDPNNQTATMSQFLIPAADNGVVGSQWWRIDVIDQYSNRSTVGFGILLVEAV